MRSRLHPLPSLVTATLLLAVTSPLPMPANSQSATQERTILVDGNELPFDEKVAVAQLLQRGNQEYRNRKYQEALKTYQQVLAIRRKLGDKAGEARALHNIGTIYFRLGKTDQARKFWEQALAIRKEIGDKAGEKRTLYNIEGIYQYPINPVGEGGGEVSLLFEDDEKQATPPFHFHGGTTSPSPDRDIITDPPRRSSPSTNRNTVPYTPPTTPDRGDGSSLGDRQIISDPARSTPPNVASPSGNRKTMPTK